MNLTTFTSAKFVFCSNGFCVRYFRYVAVISNCYLNATTGNFTGNGNGDCPLLTATINISGGVVLRQTPTGSNRMEGSPTNSDVCCLARLSMDSRKKRCVFSSFSLSS